MWRAYLRGARRAAGEPGLVGVLWLISALFGLLFAVAAGYWLAIAMDGSVATRTLLKHLDANVLIDLWYHHGEGLRMLAVAGALLAGLHTVLWWWLTAVVIVRLHSGERGAAWSRAVELAPTMAALFLLALAAVALWSAAIGGAAYGLLRATRADPSPMIWYRIGGAAALCWLLGYAWLVAVHDHARIRACATGAGALAAYAWALAFVARGGERAYGLALLLQLSAVGVWAAYQAVNLRFPMGAVLGLTGSLVWGEVFLLGRAWVRVWFFAAQNDLQA